MRRLTSNLLSLSKPAYLLQRADVRERDSRKRLAQLGRPVSPCIANRLGRFVVKALTGLLPPRELIVAIVFDDVSFPQRRRRRLQQVRMRLLPNSTIKRRSAAVKTVARALQQFVHGAFRPWPQRDLVEKVEIGRTASAELVCSRSDSSANDGWR